MACLAHVREKIKDDVLYQQYPNTNRETVSYAELIAVLMQPLDYNIMVDGVLIRRDKHTAYMISGYGISQSNYSKSYHYNASGNITMIVYTSGS
jgi:hypothetical protein